MSADEAELGRAFAALLRGESPDAEPPAPPQQADPQPVDPTPPAGETTREGDDGSAAFVERLFAPKA